MCVWWVGTFLKLAYYGQADTQLDVFTIIEVISLLGSLGSHMHAYINSDIKLRHKPDIKRMCLGPQYAELDVFDLTVARPYFIGICGSF